MRLRLVDEVHARVAEWQFARDAALWEFPQPLLAERLGRKPTKALKKEPANWSRVMRYGIADDSTVVCAQSFSEGNGASAKLMTERLVAWVSGRRVHLLFSGYPSPRLESMVVEEHEGGRLVGTTTFRDLTQSDFCSESYGYDAEGRVCEIFVHDMYLGAIESWREERITYAPDGSVKRVAKRERKSGATPGGFEEHGVSENEEQPITREQAHAARGRAVEFLAQAIAGWYARTRRSREISRVILLYPGLGNPPLPPGLSARADPLRAIEDPWELFDPDPALIDTEPPEYEDLHFQADCDLLNEWYDQVEDDPFDLMLEVARGAQAAVTDQCGQSVWVFPRDADCDGLVRGVNALLPSETLTELGLTTTEPTP